MTPNIYRIYREAASVACAIIAGALTITITQPQGPGLDPDVATYLGAAESLAHGKGYRAPIGIWISRDSTQPLTHFPPGFPTAVAVPTALGLRPTLGARLINATSAAVTVGICSYLVGTVAGVVTGVILAAAILATPALIDTNLGVMSEPLFLACLSLALFAMIRWRDRPIPAGIAAAAASIVRYAGFAVTGAVVLVAFRRRGSASQRIGRALLAGLPTVALQGAWLLHLHTKHEGVRSIGVYGGFGEATTTAVETVTQWLIPASDPFSRQGWVALGVLVVLSTLVTVGFRRAWTTRRTTEARDDPAAALEVTGVLALCYMAVIILSRLFADPGIPFDDRILAPLILAAEMLIAIAVAVWWHGARKLGRVLVAGATLSWIVASTAVSVDDVQDVLANGSDLGSTEWKQSPLLDWARAHAGGLPLFSNWPAAIYLHLHRPAWQVPATHDPQTLRDFADTLRVRGAIVLAFDTPSPDAVDTDTLVETYGFRVTRRLADGRILVPPITHRPPPTSNRP